MTVLNYLFLLYRLWNQIMQREMGRIFTHLFLIFYIHVAYNCICFSHDAPFPIHTRAFFTLTSGSMCFWDSNALWQMLVRPCLWIICFRGEPIRTDAVVLLLFQVCTNSFAFFLKLLIGFCVSKAWNFLSFSNKLLIIMCDMLLYLVYGLLYEYVYAMCCLLL